MSPEQQKWTEEQISRADRFTVVMFVGLADGLYDKRWTSSLREARLVRRDMLAEYGDTNYRRRPMIYAVVPPIDLTIFVE
ncbi:MAG: hypothetical protein KGO96_10415 [Elusimicrobia bacterium]|nr:hypothetical protein [Elusimicrobiota bacterium]